MKMREFSNKLFKYHKTKAFNDIKDIKTFVQEVYEFFISSLEEVDATSLLLGKFPGDNVLMKKRNLIDKVKKFSTIFIDRVSEIDKDPKAFDELYKLFFNDKGNLKYPLEAHEIKARTDFYRMRSANGYKIFDRPELFTIPKQNIELVSQHRFNTAGHSCLYLASNLYLAWEECRRPDFNTVNFARFQNVHALKVLRLTIPINMMSISDVICAFLSLLCCAKTNDAASYKYQYDIPNILSYLVTASIYNKSELSGIQYMSSRRFESENFMFNPRSISDAYVFIEDDRELHKLKDKFVMTPPRSYFLYKVHCFTFSDEFAKLSEYNESLFYSLEKQLKKEDLGLCDKKTTDE